ncbi:uncharacterized beta-barrel protein YwiB (DUF1934 family) [Bacillus mesophilus]|uniref:DUF1934 domain-containing protein n=1 Tax=Bacillus mesophilus TaxID=1808955 RepID=A0A6M0Q9H1_9BACI|nr:DUF1934 domain-containing protein [Bacillus mesophilus]MBM7662420.1 uncharacterized beta-barrel protein YwiB (DUF1934 family) [Bacillus mesophilus]NEY72953.1 DUF1934 domain-containing protein [Bacillus mesophilus]
MGQAVKVPVDIKFSSDIKDQEEQTQISFNTNGLYYIKEGQYYLMFNEQLEGQGPIKTTIKWSDQDAWIKRSGSVNMRIPFELHKKTKGIHETPEIKIEMTAHTEDLQHKWDEHNRSGMFGLTYTLRMQGQLVGLYKLDVQFKEEL